MKVVLDTNVLVAAYVTEGLCARLLRRGRQHQFEVLICAQILRECRDDLRKLTAPPSEALDATLDQILAISTVVSPVRRLSRRVCRDATDDGILACAVMGGADYLVTGDKDLLALQSFEAIPIVTPRAVESLFPD
jgi:putative PIN family toxin of toxin-antitoxin system